ncbi:MAG: SpoIIE family protein phosphatase [Lachnospiraceae bacterium]
MGELKGGQALTANPYVMQVDKFVHSLQHLSNTFLRLEEPSGVFKKEDMEELFARVEERVCAGCDNREWCLGEHAMYTYQMVYEILSAVEEYGIELNVETKRKLQKKCILAPRFLRETLEAFQTAKQVLLWSNRMAQNREGCAVQMDTFAQVIQHATQNLDASIFSDDYLERRIKTGLHRMGIRLLSTVFFVTEDGRYEVHVTAKTTKGQCITTKEVARTLSSCIGRTMVLTPEERPILGTEYCTIVCVEGPSYYTLQGVAKIGKGCSNISGDSFFMKSLPGGKEGVVLSDGMGSGPRASKESAMVVEMLEELLEAGFPKETAVQMMNTALVMGREEIYFSTLDMSVFNLYQGTCEFLKAGASTTFIKQEGKVDRISSMNLPIGVLPQLEAESITRQLADGDSVIMITDGVLDALPVGEQEVLLSTIIQGANINNPKEMAHHILEQVLEWTGEVPLDDMTVLVVGIWSLEK